MRMSNREKVALDNHITGNGGEDQFRALHEGRREESIVVCGGTLTPAYGRDYKSKKEALAAWNAGKDFVLNEPRGSTYIDRHAAEEINCQSFQIRWKRLTMVAVIKFKDGEWK